MSAGYIRVVNKRTDMAPDSQPEAGEVVIPVDRTHACLGNPHRLPNKNDSKKRAEVIAAYRLDLEKDMARRGPMFRAVAEIAERVRAGEKICLQCHCKPLDCHADVIAEKVNQLLANPEMVTRPNRPRF